MNASTSNADFKFDSPSAAPIIIIDNGPVMSPIFLIAVESTAGSLNGKNIKAIPINTTSRLGVLSKIFSLSLKFPPSTNKDNPTVQIKILAGKRKNDA